MKALSLWQPYAQLVALGVKTVETRTWSTTHRGPLAIHAAARPPKADVLGEWEIGRVGMWRRDDFASPVDMPLGAVIATCTLVDVVPMVRWDDADHEHRDFLDLVYDGWDVVELTSLVDRESQDDLTGQLPYGTFTPGRYAWLLDDITPLEEPEPGRGLQRLFDWPRT